MPNPMLETEKMPSPDITMRALHAPGEEMRQAVRTIRTLNISPVSRALEGERFRFGTGGARDILAAPFRRRKSAGGTIPR